MHPTSESSELVAVQSLSAARVLAIDSSRRPLLHPAAQTIATLRTARLRRADADSSRVEFCALTRATPPLWQGHPMQRAFRVSGTRRQLQACFERGLLPYVPLAVTVTHFTPEGIVAVVELAVAMTREPADVISSTV